jgi:hypothetical protein
MAGAIALNTYKTFRVDVTTGITTAYTVPNGVASIHLFSAVANVSSGITTVTVFHNRNNDRFELVKNYQIPTTDVLSPISGSLVLEVGDKIEIQGTTNNEAKFTISILESAK